MSGTDDPSIRQLLQSTSIRLALQLSMSHHSPLHQSHLLHFSLYTTHPAIFTSNHFKNIGPFLVAWPNHITTTLYASTHSWSLTGSLLVVHSHLSVIFITLDSRRPFGSLSFVLCFVAHSCTVVQIPTLPHALSLSTSLFPQTITHLSISVGLSQSYGHFPYGLGRCTTHRFIAPDGVALESQCF